MSQNASSNNFLAFGVLAARRASKFLPRMGENGGEWPFSGEFSILKHLPGDLGLAKSVSHDV